MLIVGGRGLSHRIASHRIIMRNLTCQQTPSQPVRPRGVRSAAVAMHRERCVVMTELGAPSKLRARDETFIAIYGGHPFPGPPHRSSLGAVALHAGQGKHLPAVV